MKRCEMGKNTDTLSASDILFKRPSGRFFLPSTIYFRNRALLDCLKFRHAIYRNTFSLNKSTIFGEWRHIKQKD